LSTSPYIISRSSFFFQCYGATRALHSFPTRRSSDLNGPVTVSLETMDRTLCTRPEKVRGFGSGWKKFHATLTATRSEAKARFLIDRKSTRLNSSHVSISYAVFCLKKKKQIMKECSKG